MLPTRLQRLPHEKKLPNKNILLLLLLLLLLLPLFIVIVFICFHFYHKGSRHVWDIQYSSKYCVQSKKDTYISISTCCITHYKAGWVVIGCRRVAVPSDQRLITQQCVCTKTRLVVYPCVWWIALVQFLLVFFRSYCAFCRLHCLPFFIMKNRVDKTEQSGFVNHARNEKVKVTWISVTKRPCKLQIWYMEQ